MFDKPINSEQFPTVYENGAPVAVLVDLPTFQALVSAAERLEQLDTTEEAWIHTIVERVRTYRRRHPDQVMTFDTPEAALAALGSSDA
jgi:hypothetical protein